MKYVELGRSGLKISKIGLGTWQIGSGYWGWGSEFGENEAINLIRKALELGVNFIDTAETYGGGLSEKIVGEAIGGSRENVVVATKLWVTRLTYKQAMKAIDRSLKRLGTDYVDLYFIHWPIPRFFLRSVLKAMEKLVDEGKVLSIGLSNFSLRQLRETREMLKKHDVSAVQVHYNLLERKIERNIIPYCLKEKICVLAYSPLAQGLLTGKYGRNRMPRTWKRRIGLFFYYGRVTKKLGRILPVLSEIAREKNKEISQIALSWVTRHQNVVAIPGAKKVKQLVLNVNSTFSLSAEELKMIDKVA